MVPRRFVKATMAAYGILDNDVRAATLKWHGEIQNLAKENNRVQEYTAAAGAKSWDWAMHHACAVGQTPYQTELHDHMAGFNADEAYARHAEGVMSDRTTVLAVQKAGIEKEAKIALFAMAKAHDMSRNGLIHSVSNCRMKLVLIMDNALAALRAVERLQR
jgi:hypothetical protein